MRRLVFLATFGCCAVLYLATLTDVHTYDALSYILDVDRKPWRELFHPHHLAYGPLGALIRGAAAALGWAGSAEKLLQIANALAGAFGAALFGALVTRLAGSAGGQRAGGVAGSLAALLLGASYAYWYYAVEVEVYTIAAVFLVAALGLMLALARDPSPRLAFALGLTQGCAVLFHQTNVLLCVPALVALLLGGARRPTPDGRYPAPVGRPVRAAARPASYILQPACFLAYALPLALIVGGAYLGVGLGVSGFRTWGDLLGWMAGYTTTGLWGGPVGAGKLALLGQGLAATFAQPGGALVGLALLATALIRRRALRAAPRGVVAICLSWLAVYGAFFLWWEPENIEFWIASLPPFYLLVCLAVFGAGESGRAGDGESGRAGAEERGRVGEWGRLGAGERGSGSGGGRDAWRALWAPTLLLLCGLWMLGANGVAIAQRGDAGRDLQRVAAAALAAGSAPGELIVAPDGLLELYLPFYAGREHVTSLSQAMAAAGGDWGAACELLRGRIDDTLASGYGVRIAAAARRPPPAPPGEPPTPAERFGLSPEEVAACYAVYDPALIEVAADPESFYRLPGAQALAEGPGWDFTRSSWGWQSANAMPATSDLPGWALRAGADPALTSPPLRLASERFATLEVRLASEAVGRDAQLFFLDATGQADEARAIRWTLEPGPQPHTYTIPLRGAPGWEGVITGLRLDPVGDGAGAVVVVERLRLLP